MGLCAATGADTTDCRLVCLHRVSVRVFRTDDLGREMRDHRNAARKLRREKLARAQVCRFREMRVGGNNVAIFQSSCISFSWFED